MAVNSLGYRKWSGTLAPGWMRSVVIAKTGIRRAWQSRWLRRLLLFSWMPVMWFAAGFFAFEKSAEYPQLTQLLSGFLRSNHPRMNEVADLLSAGNITDSRHDVWAWLLQTFFRYPQSVVMALVVGLIAPPLISQDIRSRAFLLYFSRPLDRFEYIVGKLATVCAYLSLISMIPALTLYIVGVFLSPDVAVVRSTWDLPIRIFLATIVLSVPTASLALCISSLTQETRVAAFAWFAILVLGGITYNFVSTVENLNNLSEGHELALVSGSNWSLVSLYHTLGHVQSWIFGFVEFGEIYGSANALLLLTVTAQVVLMKRVMSPMRA